MEQNSGLKSVNKMEKLWIYSMKFFSRIWGCHQIPERSFFLFGYQLPLCARCMGIFLGSICYLGIKYFYQFNIFESIVLMLPMIIDGFYQLITSYESNNYKRVSSGFLFGTGMCNMMYVVFVSLINYL